MIKLFLGSGKIKSTDFITAGDTHIYVDRSYVWAPSIQTFDFILQTEKAYFFKDNIFDFCDAFPIKVDYIQAYRIFEHMFFDSGEVGRLLDTCNQLTTQQAKLEILVPNAELLSNILINREKGVYTPSDVLLLNTEFCNTRSDAHGSVWTPGLAEYYITSEGYTWKIDELIERFSYAGRDIYMKLILKKPAAAE